MLRGKVVNFVAIDRVKLSLQITNGLAGSKVIESVLEGRFFSLNLLTTLKKVSIDCIEIRFHLGIIK